VTLADFGSTV